VPDSLSDTLVCAGGVKAVVCKVLKVSAEFVDEWLDKTARELLPIQPIIWVRPACIIRAAAHACRRNLVSPSVVSHPLNSKTTF